jgi:site-specific DNA-cytosine methylase
MRLPEDKKKHSMSVPVIDLFAGPGGLGEGFSRCQSVRFDIAVSIEKDGMAHETLKLRAAHRACVTRDPVTEIARFFGVRQLSAGARERIQNAIEAPRS